MSYLGLTPSEYSSGERRRQGRITNAGHTFARRALMEGAWAYRYPATGQPPSPSGAWTSDPRPSSISGGKPRCAGASVSDTSRHGGQHANQVVVAIARDMAACIWAIAREVPMARYTSRPCLVHRRALRRYTHDDRTRGQPRCGAILAGVKRRQETRGPRARQAPDGHTSGGTQPTAIRVINRRDDWLLLCRWSGDQTMDMDHRRAL